MEEAMRDFEVYAGAALLGALAGMRSMAAPAVIGQLSRNGALADVSSGLALVTRAPFANVSRFLAIGEFIADKLPLTANRTNVGPLLGRAFTGGLSGAVVCSAQKRSPLLGALLGAGAAIGAAYGAYELRRRAGQKLHVSERAIALTEDVLAGSLGAALTAHFSDSEALA
jgi:uncharacterized membrane protein